MKALALLLVLLATSENPGPRVELLAVDVAWKAPLGSSYSGIVADDELVVTMLSDGESDLVAALDAASGRERWRHRLGGLTQGHDGSDDGPLSTPAIGRGKVYALGAAGNLVALDAKDGNEVWRRNLHEAWGAERPHFGFASTPLLVDDVLVVQAGGSDGRSVVGLEPDSGKLRWGHGDGRVQYQSPVVMTLAGRQQVVVVSSASIEGLAPGDGSLLWHHELAEGDQTATSVPVFIGDDRFLVAISGDAAVFRAKAADGALGVEELYRSNALVGRSYATPVYHDGHVYGFRGQVLTCMKADDGERVWRSRPPGGDGLILVDDRLVIFGARGNVVVAEASPEGYRELTRVQALEASGLTWPGFADGRIFVRNLDEMAAVVVAKGAATAEKRPVADEEVPGGRFGLWLASLGAADDPQKTVNALLDRRRRFPVIEDEWIHFVYQGEAADVGIAGSMIDVGAVEPMTRVEGTDFFHRSFRLEPGARWEYRFQIDFEEWITDPFNPRTVPGGEGEALSEVVTPGYVLADYLDEPRGPRGRLDEFTLTSEILGYDKRVRVWLPPGYDDGEAVYPLLLVNDGGGWLDSGQLATALDNLVGDRVRPLLVAFIDADARWWFEAGGSRTDDYVRMQIEELLPALEERYRLSDEAADRAILGSGYHGVSAAYAVVGHPDVFGGVAVQSLFLGLGYGDDLADMLRAGQGESVRFYLDWNRYDLRAVDRGWDFAEDSRTVAELLRAGGYRVAGGEVLDSTGWGGWRNRSGRMLVTLFPLE